MKTPIHTCGAIRTLMCAIFASLLGVSGVGFAETETTYPNDVWMEAQSLDLSSGSISVSATLGAAEMNLTMDNDWFTFNGTQGDVPVIKVVTAAGVCFDAYVTLYDATTGELLVGNDSAPDPNPESSCPEDPRIDLTPLESTGPYYVLVSTYPRVGGAGYSIVNETELGIGGGYDLLISGITAPGGSSGGPVGDSGDSTGGDTGGSTGGDTGGSTDSDETVVIKVQHWVGQDREVEKHWKHRHGKRRGVNPMPVIIMSADNFETTDIDQSTLRFGATGTEDSLFRCSKRSRDYNSDGKPDLMCFFDVAKTDFQDGDTAGVLTGETVDLEAFAGSSTLREFRIPKKKTKSWHQRHGKGGRHGHHQHSKRHRR